MLLCITVLRLVAGIATTSTFLILVVVTTTFAAFSAAFGFSFAFLSAFAFSFAFFLASVKLLFGFFEFGAKGNFLTQSALH